MTPKEMIVFLIKEVSLEESEATSKVNRYIGDSYSPLYQCGYIIGGLQLQELYEQIVGEGKMTPHESHDAVLKMGLVPIEMIRASWGF